MKHAYLIMAHNEFEVLQKLVETLDDPRNDIYILIDKKEKNIPAIKTNHSVLYILDDAKRVAIYWGHISQIKAEFALFKVASKNCSYKYYHIFSGVHLPLKSQDYIHSFYNSHQGMQIFQPMPSSAYEINLKIRKQHFSLRYFKHSNFFLQKLGQIFWRRSVMIQSLLKHSVNKEGKFIKAANWVSLTHDCVQYLLEKEKPILKKYAHTFCGDEFFIPSELATSAFKDKCFFYPYLIYSKIDRDTSAVIRKEDCIKLLQTDFLFARKFSKAHMDSVDEVIKYIKSAS